MQVGEVWYTNMSRPHWVINPGPTDRIHLVLDCVVNDWLDTMFKEAGFTAIEKYGRRAETIKQAIESLQKNETPQSALALSILRQQHAEIETARRQRAEGN